MDVSKKSLGVKKKKIKENLVAKFCVLLPEFVIKLAFVLSLKQGVVGPPFPILLPQLLLHWAVSWHPALPPSLPLLSQRCPGWLGFFRSHLSLSGRGASFALLQSIASFHLHRAWRRAGLVRCRKPQMAKTSWLLPSRIPVTSPRLLLNQPALLLTPIWATVERQARTCTCVCMRVQAHTGMESNKSFWFWAEGGGGQATPPALASPAALLSPLPLSTTCCLQKLLLTQPCSVFSLSHLSVCCFPSISFMSPM